MHGQEILELPQDIDDGRPIFARTNRQTTQLTQRYKVQRTFNPSGLSTVI